MNLTSTGLHPGQAWKLRVPRAWLAWARHGLPIAYFAGLIAWEISAISWDSLTDPLAIGLSLLTIIYLALIIVAYVRRGPAPPISRGGWWTQVMALLGANLLIPLSMLPLTYPGLETLAVVTGLIGLAFSFWAVWHLGMAFSLVPEARRLVETGPYRWIRHPLYLAGFVIGLGLLAVAISPPALGLFLAFAGSQALRMEYEEKILAEALPEYDAYRRRTWALVPYIF